MKITIPIRLEANKPNRNGVILTENAVQSIISQINARMEHGAMFLSRPRGQQQSSIYEEMFHILNDSIGRIVGLNDDRTVDVELFDKSFNFDNMAVACRMISNGDQRVGEKNEVIINNPVLTSVTIVPQKMSAYQYDVVSTN